MYNSWTENVVFHILYFYSTTKYEILQISSLDPPNQGKLFWGVGPKLVTIMNIIGYTHQIIILDR